MTRWCPGLVLLVASLGCAAPMSAVHQRASARSSFDVRIVVEPADATEGPRVAHNPYVRPPELPYAEEARPPASPYLR